jgi:hypothetical protein
MVAGASAGRAFHFHKGEPDMSPTLDIECKCDRCGAALLAIMKCDQYGGIVLAVNPCPGCVAEGDSEYDRGYDAGYTAGGDNT